MKRNLIIAAVLFCFSASAFATWRVQQDRNDWVVVNGKPGEPGTTHIKVDSEKKGERLAKKLNDIEQDDQKTDKKGDRK